MKPCLLAFVLLIALLAAPARAGEAPSAPPVSAPSPLTLGPSATNAAGQQGRLHRVVAGETLWDISEAYLGTPWIWPSLWKDDSGSGRDAAIQPGDVLWISSQEIRRLSPAEISQLHTSAPASPPASMASGAPDTGVAAGPIGGLGRWAEVQAMGFLASAAETRGFTSSDRAASVGSVIGNPTSRAALATGDPIYIDLGAGQVQVGDRLRIVRAQRNVPDPDTGRLLGTFVEPVAWAEVTVLEGESATAVLRDAVDPVHVGDLVLPAAGPGDPSALRLESTPESVRGEIVHMVGERVVSAGMDVVYLDRGSEAGLVVGSALEVVRPGGMVYDTVRERSVKVPDTIIGQMVVLSTKPSSAAAYVLHATAALTNGDFYRGVEVR